MEETSYEELEPKIYRKIGEANPIMDIGCGEGKLAKLARSKLGW